MSAHVSKELLREFVLGEVSEQTAVQVALHIDACPACSAVAVSLEPLAAAFAAVEDPELPPGFFAAVLEEAARPAATPMLEVAVGAALLFASVVIVALFGSPVAMAADFGVVMHALAGLGRGLSIVLGSSTTATLVTILIGGLGASIAWRIAEPQAGFHHRALGRTR